MTGAGTIGSPYRVNIDPADIGNTTVLDTNTVDMSIAGDGSAGTPYVVSSNVIVDPVAGNTLVAGPGGLSVPCEAIQDCVGAGFDDGLIYDDGANQYRVRISTDPGNTVVFGGDNGVYSAAGAVTLGCGLVAGGGGAIQVDTVGPFSALTRRNCNDAVDQPGTTPLAGPDTEGMAVYCDAAGNLRTMPEKFSDQESASINESFAPAENPVFTTSPIQITITNPSSQYCMCGYITTAALSSVLQAPNTQLRIDYETDLGVGLGFSATTVHQEDTRGRSATSQTSVRPQQIRLVCLDPGETKIIQFRVVYRRGIFDGGGVIDIGAAARELRWTGVNI